MIVFEKVEISSLILKNRIFRSATFEGMCDDNGFPLSSYEKMYNELCSNEIGGIITGFAFINRQGSAIHPGQAGMDSEDKIPFYKKITDFAHKTDTKIFMQIAHTGRQTKRKFTGETVVAPSDKSSFYFKDKPDILSTDQIQSIIHDFSMSSLCAKKAGFDGIQLHAAHGYLIHQFILSSINNRRDSYGIDKKFNIGTLFFSRVIDEIRNVCGSDYPIIVKISGSDDFINKFNIKQFINLIKFLDKKKVSAIEISYGTMDYALSIMRGDIPAELILEFNPVYKTESSIKKFIIKNLMIPLISLKMRKFTPCYNLEYAKTAREYTDIPLITVGGIRKGEEIKKIIENYKIDFVSLCRPFICEPDLVLKLLNNENYVSKCINCNKCTIMCDSDQFTRCYLKKNKKYRV